MPQFDFYSFAEQIFWLLLGFFFFYFFMLRQFIVHFSEVLKVRCKLNKLRYR